MTSPRLGTWAAPCARSSSTCRSVHTGLHLGTEHLIRDLVKGDGPPEGRQRQFRTDVPRRKLGRLRIWVQGTGPLDPLRFTSAFFSGIVTPTPHRTKIMCGFTGASSLSPSRRAGEPHVFAATNLSGIQHPSRLVRLSIYVSIFFDLSLQTERVSLLSLGASFSLSLWAQINVRVAVTLSGRSICQCLASVVHFRQHLHAKVPVKQPFPASIGQRSKICSRS